MKDILKFLSALEANNNREWFNEHKSEYLKVKCKVDEIAAKLIALVGSFEPEAVYMTPAECTYRIYRDTRFSHDKTPYKTHIGIFINPPYGKKSIRLGYYLHIEPGHSLLGVGTMPLPSKMVNAIRQDIFDNVDEYLGIIKAPAFAEAFPVVGDNCVKTAPKGFPKDWEHIDLIRPREYGVFKDLTDADMRKSDIIERVADYMRVAKPFRDFINYSIDEFGTD